MMHDDRMSEQPVCPVTDAVVAHFLDGEVSAVPRIDGWLLTWTADELAEHRSECSRCDLALAQARRLDALMAAGVDGTVDHAQAEAWLDLAARSDDAVPLSREEITAIDWDRVLDGPRVGLHSPQGTKRPAVVFLAVAGTMLSVGLTIGLVLESQRGQRDSESTRRDPVAVVSVVPVANATGMVGADAIESTDRAVDKGDNTRPGSGSGAEDTATFPVTSEQPPLGATQIAATQFAARQSDAGTAVDVAGVADSVADGTGSLDSVQSFDSQVLRLPDRAGSARRRLRPVQHMLRLPPIHTGPEVSRCEQLLELPLVPGPLALCVTLGIRRIAYERLARSEHPEAHHLLIDRVASLEPGPELEGLVARLRAVPDVVDALRVRLRNRAGDRETARAAARLGGVRLDMDLRTSVRRDVNRADDVAQALRDVARRPGRIELLLVLWSDQDAREGQGDEVERSVRWFGGLDRDVGSTSGLDKGSALVLVDCLNRARSAPVRRRCMLALGALGARDSSSALVDIVIGPRHDEVGVATFALGQVHAGLDELVELIESDTRPLRRRGYLMAAAASRQEPIVLRWVRRMRLTGEEKRFLLAGSFGIEQIPIAASLFQDRYVSGF